MVDDALQIAACELIGRGRSFDSFEGLVGWVIKVAWNSVLMEWRRESRTRPGDVGDGIAERDAVEIVEGRIELEITAVALNALSDADREAILSGLGDDADRVGAEEPRIKMRRHRARRQLANILGRGADGAQVLPPRPIGG